MEFSNLGTSMMTLFRISLGIADVELSEVKQTKVSGLAAVYLIIFLVFSYLLLINLLIATMQHTQDRLSEESYLIWITLVRLANLEIYVSSTSESYFALSFIHINVTQL